MSNTLVQLTSESYHKNVLNEMHRLRLSRQLCDVTIQVDFHGELEEFEAHRTVLAATSKFFKELFLSEDEVNGKSSKVCLQQMEATDFTCFLEFVYTSRVQVEKCRVGNILEIAKLLQCQDLVDTCEQVNELKPADLQGASGIQANNLSQNVENEAGTKEGLLPLKENPLELALSTVATGNEKANTAQKTEKKREQKKDEQTKSRRLSSRLAGRKVFVDIPKKKYVRKLKDQQGVADDLSSQAPTVEITDKTGVKQPDDRENGEGDVCDNVTGAAEAAEKSDVADNEDEDPVEDDFYDVDFEIGENQNARDLEDGEKKKRGGLFRCETCQRGFKYEKSYLKHIKKSHGVMPEVIYRCSTCNQTFANRCNLKIHERHVHSDERLYPCDVCNKAFKRKKDVKRHIRQVHEGGGERHYCQICGKALSSKTALMLHERTHTGDRPYECPDCKAKFSQTSALKTHRRTHTGEKPFSCDECGARFTQNHMLAYHKRCHSGEKPFMCENCGKSFASKEYLKHHARIHTGSKPFKCEVCSRAFAQRNSLHQHMKVHTGERPYCCDQCGKQFTQLNALQRHHRIHTGEKPYMCLLCRRTFTDKSTVRRHTMTHDKETPWKNYLVVLEGNVESGHKRRMKQGNMDVSKQQDKVVPISEAIVSQSALNQANVSTEAVTEQALPVTIAADWSSNGQAIAVVSHASLGGFTVVSIENPVAVACPVSVPVSVCTPVSSDISITADMSEQTPGSSSIPITAEASSLNMTENISVEAMEISSENVTSSSLQDA